MGSLKKLNGWYITDRKWLPIVVDENGKIVLSNIPDHKTSHQDGGDDEISVASLSGLLADAQTPLAHKTSHQDGGDDKISIANLSGLLADSQNPLSHASTHNVKGSDIINYIPLDGWISANETWTYGSADDPIYTFTVSGDVTGKYMNGMRIKLKQGGNYLYFFIQATWYSAPNTTIWIYGGTEYDLANATITDNYYSPCRAPFGFPRTPGKWTVEVTDTVDRVQNNPTQEVWYNLGSLSIDIPIGLWSVSYQVQLYSHDASGYMIDIYGTLSKTNDSEDDSAFTCQFVATHTGVTTAAARVIGYRQKILALATKDTYYLNARTRAAGITTIAFGNELSALILKAVCTYL